jgi:hypothetical protein
MPAISKQAIWSRNHGRVYKKGVGEEGLWHNIVEFSEEEQARRQI